MTMKSIIRILTFVLLTVSVDASEQKKFRITAAGRVNNAEHIDVSPETKISEVIAKAGGIDVFGTKYRFYRVRIIDLNITERAMLPILYRTSKT